MDLPNNKISQISLLLELLDNCTF
ncbi:hypothetical protein DSUL_140065 [Desulfovibrionales bacterium]